MSDKSWIKNYPNNVPTEIPPSTETLNSMLKKVVQKYPQNIALSCHDHDLSFKQIDDYANRFAAFLYHELGFKKGDKIAIMLPNLLQFPVVLFGILKIGGIFVNINPLYTAHEVKEIMEDSGAQGIIVLSTFAHLAQEAKKYLPQLKHMIVTDLVDLYSFPKKQIIHFIATYIKGMKCHYDKTQFHTLSSALNYSKTFDEISVKVSCDDMACLQYSSGTTGKPKGTILLHKNIVANIDQVWSWIGSSVELDKQVIIGALPLYHIFALTANLFTFYLAGSKQVLIPNPRDIKSLVKTMQKTPFTIFNSINTLYAALLHNDAFRQSTFPHFRYTLSGGMSTIKRVADDWKAVTGVTIKEAYGLSEMSPAVTINLFDNDDEFNGTVGYPLPSTDVSIKDDNGNELATNENGEIWVKGPQQSPGFWHLDAITKEHFTDDGWLKTGDIGYLDEMGRLTISGRSKDMLIVSGFNVFPKEIENTILTIPEVKEVAVVGAPSHSSGEKPFAFVVLETGKSITAKEITEFCYTQLAHYKTPKDIMFLPELPKNTVGKVMKQELKEKYILNVKN
ncbi:long-chain-fatty-acid--CoA ligase [Fastidiosibacter lacustris]|uniref:long-chain-fatty-acid--CoA ligase n=1 Tax=Fastidiosibacter lacustris TaxID=2056695 RepID=UPI000E34D7C0|nr:long-chain fatty acid--CoA ligase [Fastidiosibacter lacustris]